VIEKAKKSCKTSGNHIVNHFVDMHEMTKLAKGTKRSMPDVKLYGKNTKIIAGLKTKGRLLNGL
jgi:hypothetical protein